MKRKFLYIISCFLALFIFVSSLFFCVPSCVSADNSIPDSWTSSSSVDIATYQTYLNSLKHNSSFSVLDDGYVCFSGSSSSLTVFIIVPSVDHYFPPNAFHGGLYVYYGNSTRVTINSSELSTYNFSLSSYPPSSTTNLNYNLGYNVSQDRYYCSLSYYKSNTNENVESTYYNFSCLLSFSNAFQSDYLTGFVTGFDYSTEAFVQWLIDTGKYQDLPAYIGTSKLVSFVDFYKQWGSSNKLFVVKILEWMAHFNIGAQSLENRNILKSTIDRLYQEYCNSSYVTFKSNSANNVHHRQNINTKTDDTNLTLVTDDPSDDTITSILRDILRGVISIPTSIYNNSQAIIAKLDSLNWTVNIANDGGASSGSDLTPVLDKMDDIIEALGSDTVSVEIDQTTKDDTDDFFDDWNLEFKTALDSKFPVASQLNLFFTDFFERCGIDADSDGEVYQYYNPGVLTASNVSRSAGTASEEDIVSDFLGKFDNSDPTFLDDASFHGVPDLSVSVGGQSVSIIDFRVYAKYRDKIHFIISFVIWTLYLLHLYKALPSIIGQVADVATKTSEL